MERPLATILLTGTTSGIGRATAIMLARQGHTLVLANRSAERADAALEELRRMVPDVRATLLRLDLASLTSVRRGAAEFVASGHSLDILINNAAVAGTRALSPEGFDLTYAVNVIGPILLTALLLPRLREAPHGRIVNVASDAHRLVRRIPWSRLEPRSQPRASRFHDYAVTKLMNVLHARWLADTLRDTPITTCAVHPGSLATGIWRRVPQPFRGWLIRRLGPASAGAEVVVPCATGPERLAGSGRYFTPRGEARPSLLAQDPHLAVELMRRVERALRSTGFELPTG